MAHRLTVTALFARMPLSLSPDRTRRGAVSVAYCAFTSWKAGQMATVPQKRIVAHSRVSAWGFLVALPMALAFLLSGWRAAAVNMAPQRLGVFVEPPAWLIGSLLIAFALFLFLIGISELARYLKPSAEFVIDGDGIAAFGLFGERRFAWTAMENGWQGGPP